MIYTLTSQVASLSQFIELLVHRGSVGLARHFVLHRLGVFLVQSFEIGVDLFSESGLAPNFSVVLSLLRSSTSADNLSTPR